MDELEKEFYLPYGQAMAKWSQLEAAFGQIMARIIGINQDFAYALYYSARSFQGRLEMFRSTIPFAKTIPAGKTFFTEAANLAATYSSTRNHFVHDVHGLEITPMTYDPKTIEDYKATLFIKPLTASRRSEISDISNANINWSIFVILLHASIGQRQLLRDAELSLELLRLMPGGAVEKPLNPNVANTRLSAILEIDC